MHTDALAARLEAVAARPVAELLACPPETGSLLNGSAQSIELHPGDVVFQQSSPCRGLYLIVAGSFVRRAQRQDAHFNLGPARAGDLVEIAAALGDSRHTYTLTAQEAGSVLLLPFDQLSRAFEAYPPLRMHLLEELAREVSRAYATCCLTRTVRTRRRAGATQEN